MDTEKTLVHVSQKCLVIGKVGVKIRLTCIGDTLYNTLYKWK